VPFKVRLPTAVLRARRVVSGWLSAVRVPVTVFLVSRVGISLVMYLGLLLFGKPAGYQAFPDNLFIDGFVRWDSFRYSTIVERGYTNQPDENGFRDTSWFPLYPIFTAAVARVVGNEYAAGLIVSNVSYLIGLLLLYRLVQLHFDEPVARTTIILLSIFPFSFFFSAMSAESLFFAAAVAHSISARRSGGCRPPSARPLPGPRTSWALAWWSALRCCTWNSSIFDGAGCGAIFCGWPLARSALSLSCS